VPSESQDRRSRGEEGQLGARESEASGEMAACAGIVGAVAWTVPVGTRGQQQQRRQPPPLRRAAAGPRFPVWGQRMDGRGRDAAAGVACESGGGGFGQGGKKVNGAAKRGLAKESKAERAAQEKKEAEVGALLTELVGALAKGGEEAVRAKVRARVDELDETWFMMAAQYAKMADAEGLEANYEALKVILRVAIAEVRTGLPPEVRLVQRLLQLNLGSQDEVAAVQEAVVREMGDEVVDLDLMARLVSTMKADVLAAKDKGYEDAASTLAVLEALVARMQQAQREAGRDQDPGQGPPP